MRRHQGKSRAEQIDKEIQTLIEISKLTATIALLTVSDYALTASVVVAYVAIKGILVVNLASTYTASRHNYLLSLDILIIS